MAKDLPPCWQSILTDALIPAHAGIPLAECAAERSGAPAFAGVTVGVWVRNFAFCTSRRGAELDENGGQECKRRCDGQQGDDGASIILQ